MLQFEAYMIVCQSFGAKPQWKGAKMNSNICLVANGWYCFLNQDMFDCPWIDERVFKSNQVKYHPSIPSHVRRFIMSNLELVTATVWSSLELILMQSKIDDKCQWCRLPISTAQLINCMIVTEEGADWDCSFKCNNSYKIADHLNCQSWRHSRIFMM